MLSDTSIRALMKSGEFRIQSELDVNIRPGSICLHLSASIRIFLPNLNRIIDPANRESYPQTKTHVIDEEIGYMIEPGQLILASTLESIGLSNGIGASISNISGLARLGLNVILSTHIAPGFGREKVRPLTLEIFNAATFAVLIRPTMRICHLILYSVSPPAEIGYDEMFPYKYRDNVATESEYNL